MAAPHQRAFAEAPPLGFGYWQDQHGRDVTARTDMGGEPVGPFAIVERGFTLPPGCHPPHDQFRILPTTGAVKRGEWRYDVIVPQQQEAAQHYDRFRDHLMEQEFKESLTQDTEVPARVMQKLGQRPMPWQVMDAARVGVEYVVWGRGKMPPKLKPYFDQIARQLRHMATPEAIARSQYEEGLDDDGPSSEALALAEELADDLEDAAEEAERKAKDAARKRLERQRKGAPVGQEA